MAATNRGRLINFINGINGVNAGGQALINMPVNARYHRNKLQATAINYSGGSLITPFSGTITAAATKKLTGAGNNDCTTNLTVLNGKVTAAAVNAGGTGYTTGDTIEPVDATGIGCVLTVTAAAGVVTGLVVTVGGTPSAISPVGFFSSVQELVNGVNMRDISAASILRIASTEGITTALGELPLYYTNPTANVNQHNEVTSWDTFGQSTFALKLGIATNVDTPGLQGVSEFDYLRNVRGGSNGAQVPFLQPVAKHEYSFNINSGVNKINTIPFDYPIKRMYFLGGTPGNLTQLEVYQDGNKVFEATTDQMQEMYFDYGFQFGQSNYLVDNFSKTTLTLLGQFNPPSFFDMAFISDTDQRLFKALTCENSLVLRVYSAIAQQLTVVVETLPGGYIA